MAWTFQTRTTLRVRIQPNRNLAVLTSSGVRQTMEQVDLMSRIQKAYSNVFSRPPNGTTAMQAFRDGKVISPLGIEGLHSIGNSLAHLRRFYELGVSYATLTHNCHNRYADAAVQGTENWGVEKAVPLWHGISQAGKDLVFEMNRLGICRSGSCQCRHHALCPWSWQR